MEHEVSQWRGGPQVPQGLLRDLIHQRINGQVPLNQHGAGGECCQGVCEPKEVALL